MTWASAWGIRLHGDVQHSCGAADARARRAAVPRTAEHLAEAIGLLDPVEEGQDKNEQAKHLRVQPKIRAGPRCPFESVCHDSALVPARGSVCLP